MTLEKCTKEEGLLLLELAGFRVEPRNEGYHVFEKIELYWYLSPDNLQNPKFLMRSFIQDRSFKKGVATGTENTQASLRKLIGII